MDIFAGYQGPGTVGKRVGVAIGVLVEKAKAKAKERG